MPPAKGSEAARPGIVATEVPLFDNNTPTRLEHPGATFICVHFESLKLGAGDRLTVHSEDGAESWTYTAADVPAAGSLWSIAIPGDDSTAVAIIDLDNQSGTASYRVDRYSAGLHDNEIVNVNQPRTGLLEICGTDDTKEARCYANEPAIYNNAKAVARLLINGNGACTGWLVGNAGHLLTNQHCIGSVADAQNVQVELMAEGKTCEQNCKGWFACRGKVVATSAQLVKSSYAKDYALLKLSPSIAGTYGYLRLRRGGPVKGERVYVPQHPRGAGKRIAVSSTEPVDKTGPSPGFAHINGLKEQECRGTGKTESGYRADSDPGASGSPVIGVSDNLVVALHHCGGCPNRGVPINKIIPEIEKYLPANTIK